MTQTATRTGYELEISHEDPYGQEKVHAYAESRPDPHPETCPYCTYEHFQTEDEVRERLRTAMTQQGVYRLCVFEYDTYRTTAYSLFEKENRWILGYQDKRGVLTTHYPDRAAMNEEFAQRYGVRPEELWNLENILDHEDGSVSVRTHEDLPFHEFVPGKYPEPNM